MRYFIRVAQEGGISKAAASLFVTQQTMSSHMAALERELGCCLFQRKPTFKLTCEGEVFLRYCKQIEGTLDSLHYEFAEMRADKSGEITVGIAQTRGKIMMPPIIKMLREQLPHVQIHLTEMSNEELLHVLDEEKADIVIGNIQHGLPGVETRELFTEHVCLAVSRQLANKAAGNTDLQTMDGYLRFPLLLCEGADILGLCAETLLEKAGSVPRIAARSRNIETLLEACALGCGTCICTDYLMGGILPEHKRASLISLETDLSYLISAAWKSPTKKQSLLQPFVDALQSTSANSGTGA